MPEKLQPTEATIHTRQ